MNPKLKKTIVVLHISAVIYFLLAISLITVLAPYLPGRYSSIAGFVIIWGIFIEVVIKGLKDNKYWAWIAGIIISGLQIPSILIILGIIGLIGLVDKETRDAFNKKS